MRSSASCASVARLNRCGADVAAGMTVCSLWRVLPTAGDLMGLSDSDAQAIDNLVDIPAGRQTRPATRHLTCRRYAKHTHKSVGHVKEAVVRDIVRRNTGNNKEWSASTVTRRRRVPVPERLGRERRDREFGATTPDPRVHGSMWCQRCHPIDTGCFV